MRSVPLSAKIGVREKRTGIYPYYAGYSAEFARWAIDKLGGKQDQSLLDPWNGTGTSTLEAAKKGLRATGIDLNPVLSFVAKAGTADSEDRQLVLEWIADFASDTNDDDTDVFLRMYKAATTSSAFVAGSPSEALLLTGMFPAARYLRKSAKTRNPSWYSRKGLGLLSDTGPSLQSLTAEYVRKAVKRQSEYTKVSRGLITIINSDFRLVTLPPSSYDLVLSSPPYLTRLDYVQATLPEIQMLNLLGISTPIGYLRNRMTGTPLTSSLDLSDVAHMPSGVLRLLKTVYDHQSKASKSYYFRFFAKYFIEMQVGIRQIAEALRIDGKLCIVTQPSYYKEVFVDLPSLLTEQFYDAGMVLDESYSFDSTHSIVSLNSRANENARRPPKETAVFYRKVK